jgi:hypothetical protein
MPEPLPRRVRFQIHLSTAIVMMFTAGAIIWANVRDTSGVIILGRDLQSRFYHTEHGWPSMAFVYEYYAGPAVRPVQYSFDYQLAALDFTVAFVFVVGVAFACEWLIRRRAARKGA